MKRVSPQDIRGISERAYQFLTNPELDSFPIGTYPLDCGIYANIDRYTTCDECEKRYESHKRYVDVQYILRGHERIAICPLEDLIPMGSYSVENDIAFYCATASSRQCYHSLSAGEGLMIDAGECHRPCVSVPEHPHCAVKKIVLKIPYAMFKDIRYLMMDVDGTMTDGCIYMGAGGEMFKAFNIKDGYGLRNVLPSAGIVPVVITARSSEMLERRCRELGIAQIYQGVGRKDAAIESLIRQIGCDHRNIAYMGDDRNDLECMRRIKERGGLTGCPFDAIGEVKDLADFVSTAAGGHGAIRDFIEWIASDGTARNART